MKPGKDRPIMRIERVGVRDGKGVSGEAPSAAIEGTFQSLMHFVRNLEAVSVEDALPAVIFSQPSEDVE